MRLALLLTASAVPMTATADNIRVIEPARHSMLPSQVDGTKTAAAVHTDPGELKPSGHDVPSPILVERTAMIDDTGNIVFGCGNSRLRDFRVPATTEKTEASR